jgi:hypothetical protein
VLAVVVAIVARAPMVAVALAVVWRVVPFTRASVAAPRAM